MSGGLLDRLRRRASQVPEPSPEEQVVQHLLALLNTRQGSSALDPEYGLPDVTDLILSFPLGGAKLCANIAKVIERYEPRVSHVTVSPQDMVRNEAILRFMIRARLVGGGELRLQSSMLPSGQVRLR